MFSIYDYLKNRFRQKPSIVKQLTDVNHINFSVNGEFLYASDNENIITTYKTCDGSLV